MSSVWGGVDVLTQRFSDHLRARGVPHHVVQQPGTRLWDELDSSVRCEPRQLGPIAEQASTVLLPSISKLRLLDAMDWRFPKASASTWTVHPLDVITAFFPFASRLMPHVGLNFVRALPRLMPRHYARVEQAFHDLLEGGGLFFMDSATRRMFDYTFPWLAQLPAPMIPIPSPAPTLTVDRALPSERLRVGYLGRMDEMKWSALGPFVANTLADVATTRPVTLLAIAEGPLLGSLEESCRTHGIRLDRRSYMPNDEARALLCRETDLTVAMGTAALDLSACGQPVVMIDPTYAKKAPAQTRFRFLHECEEYCLGEYRDFIGYRPGLRSFTECVDMLSSEDLRKAAATHVVSNHDPGTVFDSLLAAMQAGTLPYERLRQHMLSIDQSFRRHSPRYLVQNWRRRPNGRQTQPKSSAS